jgi:SsrA-binding protein
VGREHRAVDDHHTLIKSEIVERKRATPPEAARYSVSAPIAENRKAFHDYFIEDRYEAGVALEGWEVKAIRAGRVQIKEAYVMLRGEEVFLIGAHVSPLAEASTHVHPDPVRTRKLLLHAEEIRRLIGKVQRAGYTLVPLDLHYTRGRVKLAVGLAKGKRQYDKRATEKEKDWQREKQRLLRTKI